MPIGRLGEITGEVLLDGITASMLPSAVLPSLLPGAEVWREFFLFTQHLLLLLLTELAVHEEQH